LLPYFFRITNAYILCSRIANPTERVFDIPFGVLSVYVLRCERWLNGGWQRITAPPSLINCQIKRKKSEENDFSILKCYGLV